MASLRRELEELRSRMDNLGTDLVVHGEAAGSQVEWRSTLEKVEERVRGVEERVETAGGEVATIVAAEETVKEETVATTATLQTDGQQIYIIQVRVNPSDPSQKRRESV